MVNTNKLSSGITVHVYIAVPQYIKKGTHLLDSLLTSKPQAHYGQPAALPGSPLNWPLHSGWETEMEKGKGIEMGGWRRLEKYGSIVRREVMEPRLRDRGGCGGRQRWWWLLCVGGFWVREFGGGVGGGRRFYPLSHLICILHLRSV